MIVAVPHDQLAEHACLALGASAHVLVEKPAGIGVGDVGRIARAAEAARRRVKVGFNHRFHPGTARAIVEARSGRFGPVLHMRARYGHGGRVGYEQEWRARRAISGGGELVDQGMHLFDLSYSILGPLPLNAALLRTEYWPMEVEDNAVIILGHPDRGPWTMFHASWTEWKNLFSLEIFCRSAKLQVEGLAGSYGSQRLSIYSMRPELGPPDLETIDFPLGRRVLEPRVAMSSRVPSTALTDARSPATWSRLPTAGSASKRRTRVPSTEWRLHDHRRPCVRRPGRRRSSSSEEASGRAWRRGRRATEVAHPDPR